MWKRKRNSPNRIIDINWTKRKLNRVIDSAETDIHHILWKKYKHLYNVNIEQNKVRIPRKDHVAYNHFVKDKQNPREALQKLFEMCKPILKDEVKKQLIEILYNTEDKDFYIPELLKCPKKKKK